MKRAEESLLLSGELDDITALGEIRDEMALEEGKVYFSVFVGKIPNILSLLM